ncbi:MAG: SRPBCC domain-containing protein [Saprospiraceae bacterium]|nr:SRPBCC domain-containing protein [Saprospiraceae bacterium]
MNKILILCIMTLATQLSAQKAHTQRKVFSRSTSVSTTIQADPGIVWALLTNSEDYKRWNSTIISIEGDIAPGERIRLKSTLDPKRTFKLKVKKFDPEKTLIWGDAMGKRTFTLTSAGNGEVLFTMREKIGGPLFPLFAKMIPSFDASFDQFAADLKKEAEAIQNK